MGINGTRLSFNDKCMSRAIMDFHRNLPIHLLFRHTVVPYTYITHNCISLVRSRLEIINATNPCLADGAKVSVAIP